MESTGLPLSPIGEAVAVLLDPVTVTSTAGVNRISFELYDLLT